MSLKVLLPFEVFLKVDEVTRIVPSTQQGSFGILPQRRDCVAALSPGVLTYETADGQEHYLALDQGLLVKTDFEVQISVRHASKGADLGSLRQAVEKEFLDLDESEAKARSTLAKLEATLLRRFAVLHR